VLPKLCWQQQWQATFCITPWCRERVDPGCRRLCWPTVSNYCLVTSKQCSCSCESVIHLR
jgi:hypothetical protein